MATPGGIWTWFEQEGIESALYVVFFNFVGMVMEIAKANILTVYQFVVVCLFPPFWGGFEVVIIDRTLS